MKTFAWEKNEFVYKLDSFKDYIPQLISVGKEEDTQTITPRIMHSHDDRIEMILLRQGKGVHLIDGIEYQTAKGDLLIYNCDAVHDEMANTGVGMGVYSVAFKNYRTEELPLNYFTQASQRNVLHTGKNFEYLSNIFEMMYQYTLLEEDKYSEMANYLLRVFILLVQNMVSMDISTMAAPDYELGTMIKDFLDNNFLEDISLKIISESLNISPYYLSHIFKKMSGYSPIQYIIHRRIGEAQTYLLNTNLNIAKISEKVGFNNVNHFYNTFLKIIGIPPGQYRKQYSIEK